MRAQTWSEVQSILRRVQLQGWAILMLLLLTASGASADEPLSATLHCEPRVGKGRVLCELIVAVGSGRLTWADAIVVQAPDFAPPLRARLGMRGASERVQARLRLPFALMAQTAGNGQVVVKARAVWCRSSPAQGNEPAIELCTPLERSVSADVRVSESQSLQ